MSFHDCTVARTYRDAHGSERNDAFRYILRYYPRLSKRSDFNKFVDVETMCYLLSNPAVQAVPRERLDGILAWVRYDEACRRKFLHRLLAHLPGALIDSDRLKTLRCDHMVRRCMRSLNTVNDLIDGASKPYHERGTTYALGLTSMRWNGGEKLFGFVTASNKAEFEVLVEASPCMTHVKFSLKCNRIDVGEQQRLPECVKAALKVQLCAEEGKSCDMVPVQCGTIEECDVELISGGCKKVWTHRFHVDQCEMRKYVAADSKFSLFVYLSALKVNGRCFEFSSTCTSAVQHQEHSQCNCHAQQHGSCHAHEDHHHHSHHHRHHHHHHHHHNHHCKCKHGSYCHCHRRHHGSCQRHC
jgi:hypothetical protein